MMDLLAQTVQTVAFGEHGVALAGIAGRRRHSGPWRRQGHRSPGWSRRWKASRVSPRAGGRIGTNMIIAAALIEGFTFFGLVICLLGVLKVANF